MWLLKIPYANKRSGSKNAHETTLGAIHKLRGQARGEAGEGICQNFYDTKVLSEEKTQK